MKPLFSPGQVVATRGALDALGRAGQSAQQFLDRHVQGDWGDVPSEDRRLNDLAIERDERLISAYLTDREERIWVITDADRAATTLLLPEEY